jgi:ABC-type nitrate/sulfonate/bicarbonate transport system permease component
LQAARIARAIGTGVYCTVPLIAFVAAWQLLSVMLGQDILPSPAEVARLWVTHALDDAVIRSQGGGDHGFLPHAGLTMARVAGGVTIGTVTGVAMGGALFEWSAWRRAVEPLLESLRVIPPLILIPLVLVLLGPTETAQVVVCATYAALSMLVHTLNALRNVPRAYWVIAHMHRASRWQRLRTVALPAALPELLGGIRISLALGLGIVIVSEYLGAPDGIGRVLKFTLSFARVDLLLVGLVWAVLIGLLFDQVFSQILLRHIRWRENATL